MIPKITNPAVSERTYLALCPRCGNERKLSRGVVLTGRIPICDADACGSFMDVYSPEPRRPRPPSAPLPSEVE